ERVFVSPLWRRSVSSFAQYWHHRYLLTLGFLIARILGFSLMSIWLLARILRSCYYRHHCEKAEINPLRSATDWSGRAGSNRRHPAWESKSWLRKQTTCESFQ